VETAHLPTVKEVRDLLGDLLGRDITVAVVDPRGLNANNSDMVGTYVDQRLTMHAVAYADFDLAAYVGAALALVPQGGAAAAIEDGDLPQSLSENTAEFLNVLASLFNAEGAVHQRLYSVHPPGKTPPTDVAALAGSLGCRLDLDVTIAGYGGGRLAVAVAAA
jgi:hypothetical protein